MLKVITDATFDDALKSGKPLLVDFWAAWCGPCIAMEPIIKQLAEDFDGKIDIAKLNVDENPATSQRFQIMSIPTMILFKNGEPLKQIIGMRGKAELTALLNTVK
jgi:thioredoxin 1